MTVRVSIFDRFWMNGPWFHRQLAELQVREDESSSAADGGPAAPPFPQTALFPPEASRVPGPGSGIGLVSAVGTRIDYFRSLYCIRFAG